MKVKGTPKKENEPLSKPTGRIVYTFLLALVTAGLLPLGVVAHKLISISREALVTSQQQVQLQEAASMVRQLDASLRAMQEEMARLAEGIEALPRTVGAARSSWSRPVQSLMDEALRSDLLGIRYTPRGGKALEARQDWLPQTEALETAIDEGSDAARQGLISVSEPIPVPSANGGGTLIAVTVPVGPRGRAGALTGVVQFETFWNQVAGGRRASYTLYAVDRGRRLLAAQDEDGILQESDFRTFGVVQEFLRAEGRSALTTEFTLTHDGRSQEYLASFDTTERGWGIFVQLEKQQAYASVNQMIQTSLVWAAMAVLLSLGFAYLLAATVTRPIKALANGTEAFARGALDHRVSVRARNELGALAETFNSMARQIQDYIHRLRAAAQMNNELFMGTIRSLAEAIDEKDPYTRGHSDRVNRCAVLIGKQMGMSKKQIRELHISSLFHDIGKIGIEDKILRKPAGLTDEEFALMKHHPEKGAQMLAKIKAMKEIIPGIRFHHERWDGSGYPRGLKGAAIPLVARVVAVADSFDAMTTDRPYQRAMTFSEAIARLYDLSGRTYDRAVVDALAEVHRSGGLEWRRPIAAEEML